MTKTVSQKMGLTQGLRSYILNAPESAISAMHLPDLIIAKSLRGQFDYLHLFVKSQAEMDRQFPRFVKHLQPGGKLWLSWPKSGQLGTDLSLPVVIRIGYGHGMVESTTLSIDAEWSGIKFTHPKRGKRYQNSFGKLPELRRRVSHGNGKSD
jgi:hypothetical protein